jgi:hypothetical protein
MARGGFSGGPAIIDGHVLGVVTSSLMSNGKPSELGFFTVISVEPIFVCLVDNILLPPCQTEGWGDFWLIQRTIDYGTIQKKEFRVVGSVALLDDGRNIKVQITCEGDDVLFRKIIDQIGQGGMKYLEVRDGIVRVQVTGSLADARTIGNELVTQLGNIFLNAEYTDAHNAGPRIMMYGRDKKEPQTLEDDNIFPF